MWGSARALAAQAVVKNNPSVCRETPNTMQQTSVLDEGYDALDLATTAAISYVKKHTSGAVPAAVPQAKRQLSPEAARTLIVVDAACELPQPWLDHHAVSVMPRIIQMGTGRLLETRDTKTAAQFNQYLSRGVVNAKSMALASIPTRDELQRHMRPSTDAVLQICSSARRGKFYMNSLAATQSLVLIHNKVRRSMGNRAPLTAWVIDSMNVLGGLGVMAAQAASLREQGASAANIAVALNSFRATVHTLIAPHDIAFIAQTARDTENQSVPGWKMLLSGLFDLRPIVHINADAAHSIARVRGHEAAMNQVLRRVMEPLRNGFGVPFIAASYSGDLNEVESLVEYKTLRELCSRHQIVLSLATMSMSGALALGPRALAVSFASQHFRG
jgi:fatty acid-binding protein DegV